MLSISKTNAIRIYDMLIRWKMPQFGNLFDIRWCEYKSCLIFIEFSKCGVIHSNIHYHIYHACCVYFHFENYDAISFSLFTQFMWTNKECKVHCAIQLAHFLFTCLLSIDRIGFNKLNYSIPLKIITYKLKWILIVLNELKSWISKLNQYIYLCILHSGS